MLQLKGSLSSPSPCVAVGRIYLHLLHVLQPRGFIFIFSMCCSREDSSSPTYYNREDSFSSSPTCYSQKDSSSSSSSPTCCSQKDSSSSSSTCCRREDHHFHLLGVAVVIICILDVLQPSSSTSLMCHCRHHLHLRYVAVVTICIFDVSQPLPSASSTCRSRQNLHLHVLQSSSSASLMCCNRHHLHLQCVAGVIICIFDVAVTIRIFDVSQPLESSSPCIAVITICIFDVLQLSSSASSMWPSLSSMCRSRHHLHFRCVAAIRISISMCYSHHHLHL